MLSMRRSSMACAIANCSSAMELQATSGKLNPIIGRAAGPLAAAMKATIGSWASRQLQSAGVCRERVEAALANDDPAGMRSAIKGFGDLSPVQSWHVSALIDTWENSLK